MIVRGLWDGRVKDQERKDLAWEWLKKAHAEFFPPLVVLAACATDSHELGR